jgi:hypothetical protein
MLKFLKSRSNIKVRRSKIMVPIERSCHRDMKALSLTIKKRWPKLKFLKSRSNFKVKVRRSKIVVPIERSYHKKYTYEI